jgi:hypothetical protein
MLNNRISTQLQISRTPSGRTVEVSYAHRKVEP